MTKRRLAIVCAVLVIGLYVFSLTACATQEIPIPRVEANTYVYDQGDLFDEESEKKLNNMLINLEAKTKVEFVVISVESLLGYQIEDYSIKVANTLGIGKEDKDNGILLLISKPDKRVRLEIGKGMEGILNDSKCGRILDEFFVPYREKDEYTEATNLTVQAVINVIATDVEVTIDGVDQTITTQEESEDILAIFLIVLIVMVVMVGIAYLIDGSSGGGSYIGGSFGGGSSGGSFGGGSFGGGGSTR